MAAISTLIAGIGVAASVGGTLMAAAGASKAEKARQRAADLEARRAKRDQIRQAMIARAQAQSGAVAMGASAGSGIAGGMGGISSQASSNIMGIEQGRQIGAQISRGNQMVNMGGAIQSLGGFAVNNAGMFARVGGSS